MASQKAKGRKAKYVTNQNQFDQVTAENTDYLFGMFEQSRMQEETERKKNKNEPSLAQMVEKAIQILSKNSKGFYLFVEGNFFSLHELKLKFFIKSFCKVKYIFFT